MVNHAEIVNLERNAKLFVNNNYIIYVKCYAIYHICIYQNTYMTDQQGLVNKIEVALNRRINSVICQSFKENFDNKAFTNKLIKSVTDKFAEPLFQKSLKIFNEIIDPKEEKNANAIKTAMLDEIEKNKLEIQSMYQKMQSFGKKRIRQKGGGKKSRAHKPLSNTRISRRRPPILEITPHPPLLTSVALQDSK